MSFNYGIGKQVSLAEAKKYRVSISDVEEYNSSAKIYEQKAVVAVLEIMQEIDVAIAWQNVVDLVFDNDIFTETEKNLTTQYQTKYLNFPINFAMRCLEQVGLAKRDVDNFFQLTQYGRQLNLTKLDVWHDIYRTALMQEKCVKDLEASEVTTSVQFFFKLKTR